MTEVKKQYEFVWDEEWGGSWMIRGKRKYNYNIYYGKKSIFNNEECNIDNASLGAR